MTCPKCMTDITETVGNSHYICRNPYCPNDGSPIQFRCVYDDSIRFPYNQIFVKHSTMSFYRKPYLELKDVGNQSTGR
jgi:hypothetical protein